MKSATSLLFLMLLFVAIKPLTAQEKSIMEMPQIEVVPIKNSEVNRQYELYIELPESYSENKGDQYPVVYYTDAKWHMEILATCQEYIMDSVILVGISWQKDANTELQEQHGAHVSRFWDYSVLPLSNPERQRKYNLGQAAKYLSFIRKDVFSYVEQNYRADPANRTYFGYSLGGLFGAYALLAQPDTFAQYIIGSPSLERNMDYLSQMEQKPLNSRVFFSYGTLEDKTGKYVEEFISLLNSRNDTSLKLEKGIIEGNHQTAFPGTGVKAVTWLANLQGKD